MNFFSRFVIFLWKCWTFYVGTGIRIRLLGSSTTPLIPFLCSGGGGGGGNGDGCQISAYSWIVEELDASGRRFLTVRRRSSSYWRLDTKVSSPPPDAPTPGRSFSATVSQVSRSRLACVIDVFNWTLKRRSLLPLVSSPNRMTRYSRLYWTRDTPNRGENLLFF